MKCRNGKYEICVELAPRGFNPSYVLFYQIQKKYFCSVDVFNFKFQSGCVYWGCIWAYILIYIIYSFYGRWKVLQEEEEREAQAELASNYIFSNQIGCRYGNVMIIQIL